MVLNAQRKNTYEEFVNKFKPKPKKTPDDCMTPQPVYDAVLDYVKKHYELAGKQIERPFWPGGDYQAASKQYNERTVVVDNPPFSILTKILKFYIDNNIKFFILHQL